MTWQQHPPASAIHDQQTKSVRHKEVNALNLVAEWNRFDFHITLIQITSFSPDSLPFLCRSSVGTPKMPRTRPAAKQLRSAGTSPSYYINYSYFKNWRQIVPPLLFSPPPPQTKLTIIHSRGIESISSYSSPPPRWTTTELFNRKQEVEKNWRSGKWNDLDLLLQ